MTVQPGCVFCAIVSGKEPASVIYRDDVVMAFMTIRPTRPGECLIIPTAHIDHFTDIGDGAAAHLMVIAQGIARRLREVFKPLRVGMVVHGFGVAHAHLILVPQHNENDITSGRFAHIIGDQIVFNQDRIPMADRSQLDAQALLLGPTRTLGAV